MLTFNFTPFPCLETERLTLREVRDSDVNEMFRLRSDPRILEFLDRKADETLEDVAIFIRRITESRLKNEDITWAICKKGEDKLLGDICYWRLVPEHHRAEIGYAMQPEHWGNGIITEAVRAVVDYGFNVMNLHSIEANVNPTNASSIKVLEKNGFVREGYFKENYYYSGQFLDSAIYSLVKSG